MKIMQYSPLHNGIDCFIIILKFKRTQESLMYNIVTILKTLTYFYLLEHKKESWTVDSRNKLRACYTGQIKRFKCLFKVN